MIMHRSLSLASGHRTGVSSFVPVLAQWGRRRKVTVTGKSSGGDSSSKGPEDHLRTRNVGIMAHIDAGKTTTTERFLYYSGVIGAPGEVHHGDTVTDFLPQERERGITIQSAVVSFPWKGYKVNLIDTPGHVDFTFEVQRSLRVVDSAVTILDASAGVEAQTLTVWRQAAQYNLPKLIYLNKMDKKTSSIEHSLDSISSKLKCTPILLQFPFYENVQHERQGSGSGLRGIVDLIELRRLIFSDSKGANISSVDVANDVEWKKRRAQLVDLVADLDSKLADHIIENESVDDVSSAELHSAVRRVTLSSKGVPVLLGSSYKNVGVQPLMDGILRYCPHPSEGITRDPVLSAYGSELCSFAFKTMHDPQLGPLTFLRVFTGTIQSGQKVYNVSRGKHEKISKVYLPMAEELQETGEALLGEVVIVSGLKETITGDTLASSHTVSVAVSKKLRKIGHVHSGGEEGPTSRGAVLGGVHVPEPVFFCSVEPASISQQKALEAGLECLKREDPSLQVHTDPDSGQIILSGMGELHLDIIHKRLQSDFKADADLGKIQVAYKETISCHAMKRTVFERRLADQKHSVCIELELNPVAQGDSKLKIYRGRDKEKGENLSMLTDKQIKHIQSGIDSVLRFGPKLSFPMINVEVTLHWFETTRGTSDTIIEAASASCFRDCIKDTNIYLLEPIVSLEVTVDENYQRVVLDDLNRRRFVLEIIDVRHGNKVITGTAPLSELLGYSTILRTISSGLGTFSMHFSHHQLVNPLEEQKIVTLLRGF